MLDTPFLALTLALVPGLFARVIGRGLIADAGEPDLAERLMVARKKTNAALLFTWVALLILTHGHALWAGALAILGTAAGGFSARRRLFEETWSLSAFLLFQTRFLLGYLGPWLVLLVAPLTLLWFEPWVGLLIALPIILAWTLLGGGILLRLLGAKPVEDPELLARFDAVLRRASCRPPKVFHAGAAGGRFVNGFAIPTPWAPAVLLSDDLIDNLMPEETTGIFAHEVAHLEQFTLRRWVPRVLLPPALLVALMVPFSVARVDSLVGLLPILWPLVCLLALVASFARSRADETDSDLRAAELTGDAESLIGGLTKIHSLSLLPSRIEPKLERHMTHPSLEKRIAAIRGRADRTDGADRTGWTDEADRTDRTNVRRGRHASYAPSTRLPALLTLLAGIIPPFSLALLVAGGIAKAWPTPGVLVGAGLIAALEAAGGLARGHSSLWGLGPLTHPLYMLVQLGLGVWLVTLGVLARRGRLAGDHAHARGPWVLAALATVALLFGALLTLGSLPAMRLHLWLAEVPAALLLFLGAATALLLERRRRERRIGTAFAALALAQLVVASDWFRGRFSGDFFDQAPAAIAARAVDVEPILTVAFGEPVSEVLVSPSGRRVAARVHDYDEYAESSRVSYRVEWDGRIETLDAVAAAWVGDDALLTVSAADTGAVLAAHAGVAGRVWQMPLPHLLRPSLSVRDHRWTIWSFDSLGVLTEYRGRVGASGYESNRHRLPDQRTAIQSAVSDGLGGALLVAYGMAQPASTAYLPILGGAALTSHLTLASSTEPAAPRTVGTTAMMLSCVPALTGPAEFGCAATSGDRTEIWLVDGEKPRPLGRLPGGGMVSGSGGGLAIHRVFDDELILVDFPAGETMRVNADALRPSGDTTTSWITAVDYRPGVLAVVRADGEGGSRVEVFLVGGAAGPRGRGAANRAGQ